MSKIEIDLDVQDEHLEHSGDGDYLDIVDDGSFDSQDSKHLITLTEDSSEPTYYKDLSGSVTYRVVLPTENTGTEQTTGSPASSLSDREYYVIGDPVQMYTCPPGKKAIRRDPLQQKTITKKRDDKRRATHNEVERRRRDKINTWITKLAALIPNSGLPDSASKGGILAKACDHITELTDKHNVSQNSNKELVNEVFKLKLQLNELRKENVTLKNLLSHKRNVTNGSS